MHTFIMGNAVKQSLNRMCKKMTSATV